MGFLQGIRRRMSLAIAKRDRYRAARPSTLWIDPMRCVFLELTMSSQIRWLATPLLLLLTGSQVFADACIFGRFTRRSERPTPLQWVPDADPEHDFTIVSD